MPRSGRAGPARSREIHAADRARSGPARALSPQARRPAGERRRCSEGARDEARKEARRLRVWRRGRPAGATAPDVDRFSSSSGTASGSARSDEPPPTLAGALAELGAQALDAGLVDEVLGRQLERLLPGVERFAIAVLRAQRDPEIEQLDGALERVSFRFDG